ncbi:MAG TPA: DUF6391 domain-containing protein [Anaerolineae bacterium]|nr:DUF6391 domain-containing protein [Anaerolineae bacterium]HOQ97519.1 DUF6391 domain-containing protein [Anaerolineae bacterium]HPL30168.1 DUF6391 domain-containing protein [Anaerolineae bacterium]
MPSSTRSFSERVRRNHALEHATLHVLARDLPNLSLVGRSDWRGFLLYGEVPTDALKRAVREAHQRLEAGQKALAVHPRCGTNLAVAVVLSGAAMMLGMLAGTGDRRRRWPVTLAALAGALTLARPLGPEVQRRMTTDPDMAGVAIGPITATGRGMRQVHRVEIEHTK